MCVIKVERLVTYTQSYLTDNQLLGSIEYAENIPIFQWHSFTGPCRMFMATTAPSAAPVIAGQRSGVIRLDQARVDAYSEPGITVLNANSWLQEAPTFTPFLRE